MTWRDRAACAGSDPDAFFPPDDSLGTRYGPARRICSACDVQAECLDYAVREGISEGLWGGLSPRERRSIQLREAR